MDMEVRGKRMPSSEDAADVTEFSRKMMKRIADKHFPHPPAGWRDEKVVSREALVRRVVDEIRNPVSDISIKYVDLAIKLMQLAVREPMIYPSALMDSLCPSKHKDDSKYMEQTAGQDAQHFSNKIIERAVRMDMVKQFYSEQGLSEEQIWNALLAELENPKNNSDAFKWVDAAVMLMLLHVQNKTV